MSGPWIRVLLLSHTHTHRCCLHEKKSLLLSFPESLVVSPSMLVGCGERGEELKSQRSPEKNVWSFLSPCVSNIYHFHTSMCSFVFRGLKVKTRQWGVCKCVCILRIECVYVFLNTLSPLCGQTSLTFPLRDQKLINFPTATNNFNFTKA